MNDLEHYMSLQYRIELIPDEGGIVARIPDLPGCMSSGDNPAEALEGLNEAKELWISARLDSGLSVPEPSSEEESYSGKFVLRIPKSLHRALDERARAESMSLNSYLLYLLTERHTEHSASHQAHTMTAAAHVCWEKTEASHAEFVGTWGKAITARVKGFKNIDESLEHIAIVPRPPQGSFVLGLTKGWKKKEFSH